MQVYNLAVITSFCSWYLFLNGYKGGLLRGRASGLLFTI
jgi:hypothetical protein